MKIYYLNDPECPLVAVGAATLHQELKAALSDEDYGMVQINSDYVKVPDAGEAVVLAHGSQASVDARAAAKTISEYAAAVQKVLDAKANERGYDGILSLCSYATSTNTTFAAEGQAGVEWRDGAWAACYALLNAWQDGTIPAPSEADVIAALPVMAWPVA